MARRCPATTDARGSRRSYGRSPPGAPSAARVAGGVAPSAAVLGAAVQAAKGMSSDGDKATILRSINARAGELPAVRAAVVDAASTIASDGDRAGVLTAVLASATDEATLVG